MYVGKRQPGITLTFNRVKLGSSRGSGGSFRALSIFNFISPQKSYRGFVAEGFFWEVLTFCLLHIHASSFYTLRL